MISANKVPSYSFVLLACGFRHLKTVLNPEEREKGVLIRRFLESYLTRQVFVTMATFQTHLV